MARRKILVIKIPPSARGELEKFLERLEESVYADTVVARVSGDYVRLYMYGSNSAIERSVRNVRRILREYSTPRKGRLKYYSIRGLSRTAGTAIPGDVLETILKIRGYKAELSDDRIGTDAPENAVYAAAQLVGDAIRETERLHATRTCKKLVIAAKTLVPHLAYREIIERAIESGVAVDDDEGKCHVIGDWREALKMLYKQYAGSGVEYGFEGD